MKDNNAILNHLLQAGCTPSTPITTAIDKVAKHFGYESRQFKEVIAYFREAAPQYIPAKYGIQGRPAPTVPGKATISGPLSPRAKEDAKYNWQAGIDFLARSLDLSRLIPSRFTRLADLTPR